MKPPLARTAITDVNCHVMSRISGPDACLITAGSVSGFIKHGYIELLLLCRAKAKVATASYWKKGGKGLP
jgi:hypothetical protein